MVRVRALLAGPREVAKESRKEVRRKRTAPTL